MFDENRSYLLERRASALEERLGHYDQLGTAASALEERLGHYDQLGTAASALEERLGHYDQLGTAASALEERLGHYDQLGTAASALEERLGHYDQLGIAASALEERLGHYDQLGIAASALEERLGHYDQLGTAASALEERLGHYDQLGIAASALEERLGHYDQLGAAASALEERLGHYDQLGAAASALEERLGHYDQLGTAASANMESLMKLEEDWQKQVNFLSETQASLGFPDIIRSGLSADPFRISTPTQRRTPLVEPSPTANTSEVYEEVSPEIIPAPSAELVPIASHAKVFIVHGHDHPARDTIAKFVNNLGLTAIILDKEPDKGRTIIEKFEDLADEAGFAIVLLTPDDVGGLASAKHMGELKPRARQNVMWEWGYFCKAIGRQQVCLLCKGKVELPSDTHGLLYIPMDDAGKWQQKIIREMVEAQVLANANKI